MFVFVYIAVRRHCHVLLLLLLLLLLLQGWAGQARSNHAARVPTASSVIAKKKKLQAGCCGGSTLFVTSIGRHCCAPQPARLHNKSNCSTLNQSSVSCQRVSREAATATRDGSQQRVTCACCPHPLEALQRTRHPGGGGGLVCVCSPWAWAGGASARVRCWQPGASSASARQHGQIM